MIEYTKIDTLFERDERFSVTEVLKRPVLATINPWVVTEKIDGTNIRVDVRPVDGADKMTVGGRTAKELGRDNAQIHAHLIRHLYETLSVDKIAALRLEPDVPVTLFGEGYGAGIQKGGAYREDKGFILFDVLIADKWWMDDATVTEMAERLGVPRVPILGEWSLAEITERVKAGIPSLVAPGRIMEGIVARPREPLFDRNGKRLILKLKTCDWK